MALINYPLKEMTIKIVYYGPGLSGKTTSLRYIYDHLPDNKKGKIVTLSTEGDRTFFFDFLPITTGKIGNFNSRIQLYTVPGQVFYENTRRMVLQGTDGAIFVADSQEVAMEANKESLNSLYKNLKVNNIDINSIPIVMAYNKRDLSNILPVSTLNKELNINNFPYFETSAITGQGIMETLEETIKLTLNSVRKRYKFQVSEEREETVVFDREALREEEKKIHKASVVSSFGVDPFGEKQDKEEVQEEATIKMGDIEEIAPIEDETEIQDIPLEEYKSNDNEEIPEISEEEKEEEPEEEIDLLQEEEEPVPLNEITELSNKFAEETENIFEEQIEDNIEEEIDNNIVEDEINPVENDDTSSEMFGGDTDLKEIIKVSLGKKIKVEKTQIIIPLEIKLNEVIKKVNIKLNIDIEEE